MTPSTPKRGRPRKDAYVPPPRTEPSDSYWVGLSRDALSQKVSERLPIMRQSKFGKYLGTLSEPPS